MSSPRFRKSPLACAAVALGLMAGCGADIGDDESNFTSDEATLLQFEFDMEFVADRVFNVERLAEDQLLYTIGHLNGDNSVGRFDKLELSNIERTELEDGRTHVRYHASMPVAWGSKTNLPETYEFKLPINVDHDDYESFTEKYSHSCVDWGAHDVDSGSMWYYFRPAARNCQLAPEDIAVTTATVTVSDENTTGKYPEYHKVWEDNALTVVAIFGKYEDGATTSSDAGISAYSNFVEKLRGELGDGATTEPAEVPSRPGVEFPDVTFRATRPDGRQVEVVALLVDNVRTADYEFDARYSALSGNADMIFYNGHAGLGANVRALAQKGEFIPGKYQIFFMNGCDSFAYVDGHLVDRRAEINPDDPTGSIYMDMITNVMPSYFHKMPHGSMAIINGLLSYDEPVTYEQIFENVDPSEVIVVTGEEDNVYEPGFNPGGGGWEGIEDIAAVAPGEAKHYELGELPAGTYVFSTADHQDEPGGDVDMYIAVGRVPTTEDWDHRPYEWGSDEQVTLKLEQPAPVYLMVYGYEHMDSAVSGYTLNGKVAE